jgi:hypothetical protein
MNFLRNLALERVKTSHVFMSDVDLVPNNGLEDVAIDYITRGEFHRGQVSALQMDRIPSVSNASASGFGRTLL